MAMSEVRRVAVIGAGAAGLAAARRMKQFFDVTVFEATESVGGTWHYTDECDVHGSMYRDLHTNLPKDIMAFPGFPFHATERSFVHHSDVQKYLVNFVSHFDLGPQILFGHRVQRVSRHAHTWHVTVEHEGSAHVHDFDAVAVCNGHYADAYVPDIPGIGHFKGAVLHSHNYRAPEPFADKVVAVLGGGQSGRDISQELAAYARQVYFCHSASKVGRPELTETRPIASCDDDGRLITEDSHVIAADTLIYATGYNFSFPFLDDTSGIEVLPPKRVLGLYQHVVSIAQPTLAVVGLPLKIVPFPQFDMQARWLCEVWSGRTKLPAPDAMRAAARDDEEMRRNTCMDGNNMHVLGPLQWAYNDALASQANLEPLESWRREIYEDSNRYRPTHPWNYKFNEYHVDHSTGEWTKHQLI